MHFGKTCISNFLACMHKCWPFKLRNAFNNNEHACTNVRINLIKMSMHAQM